MDNKKKIDKTSMKNVDIWASISIGTTIAIGTGSGIAIGLASNSLSLGIVMGSLFAVFVGLVTIGSPKK